ncbi:PucR family transcriptional regulator [Nocardioides sp. DS6]|uniref:PucR family transcriptional regulator n=1 Tax=Nocardioides eburneus TaxID=3231482 RepID=A0ABV3T234_9ACTN
MTPSPSTLASRRRAAAAVLQRATGRLATAATARMDSDMPWFRDLSAQDRSWVGMIVQAGIREFLRWYAAGANSTAAKPDLATSMFGEAPRTLTGVITLRQTVDLVRLSIEVVEANVDDLLDPDQAHDVHDAISRYAREVAFATAEVYARAAEQRGAWDARLEALVVDAVLRAETDEAVLSRASALGWDAGQPLSVVLGAASARPADAAGLDALFEEIRHRARAEGLEALCAVQGDRLVVLLGGVKDATEAAAAIADLFGEGPVVVGPVAPGLGEAQTSARAALAAYRAAPGWPEAPRPAPSDDFLPERVLAGDGHARRHLVDEIYRPLVDARSTLIETLTAYFDSGRSLEATARALFVHTNTVRYRLRQVADLTGYSPGDPRDALTLRLALILGRQSARTL